MKLEKNVQFSGKKAKGYLNREVAELRWAEFFLYILQVGFICFN